VSKPLNVLVVDDEPDIRELLGDLLVSQGMRVCCAAGANEALSLLKGEDFDLVVTDLQMAEGDGFDLLQGLRTCGRPKPRVILISGHSDFSREDLLASGADLLLLKPFRTAELVQKIRELLSQPLAH
jgi:DNA-binding response OmpR family regulator